MNSADKDQVKDDDKQATKNEKRSKMEQLEKAKVFYKNTKEYCKTFTSIVKCERKCCFEQNKSLSFKGIEIKWDSPQICSFLASGIIIKSLRIGSELTVSISEDKNCHFETAIINKIDRRNRIVHLFFREKSKFFNEKIANMYPIFSDVPFQRQLDAIKKFEDESSNDVDPFIRDVILGHIDKDFQKKNQANAIPFRVPKGIFPDFNYMQKVAAITALRQKITFIQGPPGTGKTTVLAAVVYSLAKAQKGKGPILVVGHSNITADFACDKLGATDLNVGRIYSQTLEELMRNDEEFADDDIIPGFDPSRYSTHKRTLLEFKKQFGHEPSASSKAERRLLAKLENELINKYDVICSTVSSIGQRKLSETFKTVVFDEASQLLDTDILIAITRGAEKIILFGDHKQLAPIIMSEECRAAKYDFSLLMRMIASKINPIVLVDQYRMHPDIAEFPNKMFYASLLKNGISREQRVMNKNLEPWSTIKSPQFFWNVESKEETLLDSKTYLNRNECSKIAQIIDSLFNSGVSPQSIGIITPYAGQQYFLIDNLSSECANADDSFINSIEISSVDGFQGREKDVIILSCVRANDSNDIGFTKEDNRLNVSLTRAKYALAIIGNVKTFSKSQLWNSFVHHFFDKGLLVEGETISELKVSHIKLDESKN